METPPPKHTTKRPAGPCTFLTLNAVYLAAVYGASLWIHPLGKDYANMAAAQAPGLPIPKAIVWAEMQVFGAFLPGYHLTNMLLLYGTMVCLFFFTRRALRGPWWLGSLVAVLTMANPMKGEAVLRVTGVDLLWPMLLSAAALLILADHLEKPRMWKLLLVHACVLAGPAFDPVWRGMGAVLAIYAALGAPESRLPRWPFLAFAAYSALPPYESVALQNLLAAPHESLGPLFLVFYPIGLLPETVTRLDQHVWLAWTASGAALALAALVFWKAPHPGVRFALLAMLAFRLLQPAQSEDLVHMAGGGRFLMPIALGSLALTALAFRAAQHPKWTRHVIMFTTVLCVVFFALQWREIAAWYRVAGEVKAYQAQPESPTLEPDYHRTAPRDFEAATRHATPFSAGEQGT